MPWTINPIAFKKQDIAARQACLSAYLSEFFIALLHRPLYKRQGSKVF
jgi:hypothetical protein